jgi:Holliday junction resolvase RusA-like endonuclease
MTGVRFMVPGIPQGKGRARMTTINGRARSYTPGKTVAYESLIAMAAKDALDGREPFDGAVYLCVTAIFPVAASWSKKRKAEARWHTSKPDGDNIAKAVGDGCNGVLWRDDSQVSLVKVVKVYGDQPGLDVMVEALA